MMEFHISREARDRYQVQDTLFNFVGNVIFGDLGASRRLAHQMNEVRESANDPARVIHPGALFAMGLLDEMSHVMIARYRRTSDPQVNQAALAWFAKHVGKKKLDGLLRTFVEEFPNIAIYRGGARTAEWLKGSTDGMPHREAVLEEMLLLWLANRNPAFRPFRELYDDTRLMESIAYKQVTEGLQDYFATRPATGMGGGNLLDLLRAPMESSPDSLSGQLAWIRENWAPYLGDSFRRLLLAVDVLKEEDVAIWMRFHPPSHRRPHDPFAKGRAQVPEYRGLRDIEYERFSRDQDWMPNVVMVAKSTYVWVAQLSRQYGHVIERLDQIPDEELELLASRGLNALWLIGVWERSQASQTIKRLCGQGDAVASAYSLADYRIAGDLGGDYAYGNLRDRAARYGIRLASDMVPNHMGIDSNWVIENPEWFLSRGDSPYPAYRFDGPDLSHDSRVEIKIEDQYYSQSDAAVVFRRRDNHSGHVDYIYHGNDGTSFPWNDTAQLNYLRADVRERVIQAILHVARMFPIIRFDAAMTLARRHVERLWFPLPGSGGSIPSRAECSMTREEFDAAMPAEFWREVVDRVAAEVPGTLLLAEAFWLMEGYFVRTLGMHRVYNSAFMNMLRDEDNSKYRSVIKNTIAFDPDILKRYVNFMSNPDERTAVDQFGAGDKYFGVCTMMATLPGLPMFGHGQIESFTEKYGMEYKRPRYDETPNRGLVERHQREIAPLLKDRAVFAESSNFELFDFFMNSGFVDEDVFAYSNRLGDRRALVVYHNKYAETEGTLHHSAARADKNKGSQYQTDLHRALDLSIDHGLMLAFQDNATGLHYLRRSIDIARSGLRLHLHAYQCHVFQNWRELSSTEEYPWEALCDDLNGTGVWSLDDALEKFKLRAVHGALRDALDPALLRALADIAEMEGAGKAPIMAGAEGFPHGEDEAEEGTEGQFLEKLCTRAQYFYTEARAAINAKKVFVRKKESTNSMESQAYASPEQDDTGDISRKFLLAAMKIPQLESAFRAGWPPDARAVLPSCSPRVDALAVWAPVVAWCLLRTFLDAQGIRESEEEGAAEIFDRLYLRSALAESFAPLGMAGEDAWRAAARVRVLLTRPDDAARIRWDDPDIAWLTGLHDAEGVRYFNKEAYEQLLWWNQLPRLIDLAEKSLSKEPKKAASGNWKTGIARMEDALEQETQAAERAGYRLDRLLTGNLAGNGIEKKSAIAKKRPARRRERS